MATIPRDLSKLIPKPGEVAEEMRLFRASAEVFSSNRERLIDKYDGRWVAVYHGEIVADGETLGEVLDLLKEQGVPKEHALIRRIHRSETIMFL